MSESLLREFIREAVSLFHGSPYGGIKRFSDYRGRVPFVFFTPSRDTALDYLRPLALAGTDPGGDRTSQKTIYHVEVDVPDSEVFDTGKNPGHSELYSQIRKEVRKADPDDALPGLTLTPTLEGGSVELPSFAVLSTLFPYVARHGFRAIWFSEGSQGPSFAIRQEDASSVRIVKTEEI